MDGTDRGVRPYADLPERKQHAEDTVLHKRQSEGGMSISSNGSGRLPPAPNGRSLPDRNADAPRALDE